MGGNGVSFSHETAFLFFIIISFFYDSLLCIDEYKAFYYVDRIVLIENTLLVKFIQNHIRDLSGIFSISLLVRILKTTFPAFFYGCLCKQSVKMTSDRFAHIIRKLHGGYEYDMNFCCVKNNISLLTRSAVKSV